MDLLQAMHNRHSVRSYTRQPIEGKTKEDLLAPTAMNQQKFVFSLKGNTVTVKAGIGFYSKIDLGIAKYHFELGAGAENFKWGE